MAELLHPHKLPLCIFFECDAKFLLFDLEFFPRKFGVRDTLPLKLGLSRATLLPMLVRRPMS